MPKDIICQGRSQCVLISLHLYPGRGLYPLSALLGEWRGRRFLALARPDPLPSLPPYSGHGQKVAPLGPGAGFILAKATHLLSVCGLCSHPPIGDRAPSASDPKRRPHGHSSAWPLPLYGTASEYQPPQTAFQRRNNAMNRGFVQISTLHTGHLSKRRQEGLTRGLRMNRAPGGEQSITPRPNGCRGYDRA